MVSDPIRWESSISVYPVRLNDEPTPKARPIRLACAAMRKGDLVQVTDGKKVLTGTIADIVSAIVHVRTAA